MSKKEISLQEMIEFCKNATYEVSYYLLKAKYEEQGIDYWLKSIPLDLLNKFEHCKSLSDCSERQRKDLFFCLMHLDLFKNLETTGIHESKIHKLIKELLILFSIEALRKHNFATIEFKSANIWDNENYFVKANPNTRIRENGDGTITAWNEGK